MNKFSLLLITFVFLGGTVASGVDVQRGVEVDPNVKVTPAHAELKPAKVEVTPGHVDVTPTQVIVAPTEVKETVPVVVSVKGEVNTSAVSAVDRLKVFLGGFLVKAQDAGSVVKYYLLGDVLTDLLSKKGFIVTPDAGLINAYVNGITPRRLVNVAAVSVLVALVYYGYKALSKDQDEDDFSLDEEDEDFE